MRTGADARQRVVARVRKARTAIGDWIVTAKSPQLALHHLSQKLNQALFERLKCIVPKLHVLIAIDPDFAEWIEQFDGLAAAVTFMRKHFGISILNGPY